MRKTIPQIMLMMNKSMIKKIHVHDKYVHVHVKNP